MTNIVILGAGYAGLAAAVQLAARTRRDDSIQVTLVNASDRFTERLRLPMTATGQDVADRRVPDLLAGTGARFEPGWVTALDLAARTVTLDDRKINFDLLVYALGSVADTGAVPGADEYAYTLNSFDDAAVLAAKLAGATDVVIGGTGPTGVESAAEIASRYPHLTVTLVGRHEPGAGMCPGARAHLRAALDRLGVRTVRAEIRKVLPDRVHLDDGTLPAGLVLWAGGTRVSPLAAAMTTDDRGRIVTDPSLRSVSHPFVYAIGDAAAIRQPYGIMHGTCQGGMPTGVHAALSILRELTGKPAKPFRFGYYQTPVSLGRQDGVVQFTHGDDTPRRFYLTGRLAARYKEIATAAPWPTYRRMRRLPASAAFWPHGKRS